MKIFFIVPALVIVEVIVPEVQVYLQCAVTSKRGSGGH